IVGYVRTASGIILVQNCRNDGDILGTNDLATGSNIPYVGGIIGRNEIATAPAASITIKDCINTGDITSSRITGGITAYISNGEGNTENPVMVTGCVNLGDVKGSYFAAGIVTYAELNSIAKPHFIENCLNTGHISFDFLDGFVFEPSTSNQEAAGGITARNRGASVKNCVNLGVVDFDDDFRVLAGALVGKMDSEMTVPAEILDNYYLYNRLVLGLSMFPNTSNVAIGASGAADKANYATLDFDGAWVMTDKCPVPAAFAGEAANITIENVELPAPVVETTAAVTETEQVIDNVDNGGSSATPIIIAVVAVIAVAAAVAVVIVIKKKK
ncbi:MAG: hypothetical protein IKY12_01690, partial [Clostridia bacterium]|nr:hypothetical protein [Clostridia bacterium]